MVEEFRTRNSAEGKMMSVVPSSSWRNEVYSLDVVIVQTLDI